MLIGWVWVDFVTPSVIEEETEELNEKPLRTLQAVNDLLENQLGYMNSNRLSKPNLPDTPKPSKLLAPTNLSLTMSSLTFRIPQ